MAQAPKPIDINIERSLGLSPGNGWTEQSRIFIRIYDTIIETGLLAEIDGNALKVLIALGLQATTLRDGEMFKRLKTIGLVDDEDKGKLVCYASQEDLASRCGMSRQTLSRKAEMLAALGLIEMRSVRGGDGKFTTTLYIIKEGIIGKFGKGNRVKRFNTANDNRVKSFNTVGVDPQDGRVKRFNTAEGHRVKSFNSINEDNNIAVAADDIHQQQQQQDIFFNAAKTFDTAGEIFSAFARAFGLADYRPSGRDYRVLNALYREGYSDEEILAGIERAAAYARQRGTVPRSFAYVAAAVRQADADSARGTAPATGTDTASGAKSLDTVRGETEGTVPDAITVWQADADSAGGTAPTTVPDTVSGPENPDAVRGENRDAVPEARGPDTAQAQSGDAVPRAATVQPTKVDADSASGSGTAPEAEPPDTAPGVDVSLPEGLRQTLEWLGVRGKEAWKEILGFYESDPNRVERWVKFVAERWKDYENAPGFLRSMLRSGEPPPPDRERRERYSVLHGRYAHLIKH